MNLLLHEHECLICNMCSQRGSCSMLVVWWLVVRIESELDYLAFCGVVEALEENYKI